MSEQEKYVRSTLAEPGSSVFIVVSRSACVLPSHLQKRKVCLEIGLQMQTPIPDLVINRYGIHGTLVFGKRGPQLVHVPWEAIVEAFGPGGFGFSFAEGL